jgi:hypothetical protein
MLSREQIETLRQWQLAHCSNNIQVGEVNALCDQAARAVRLEDALTKIAESGADFWDVSVAREALG